MMGRPSPAYAPEVLTGTRVLIIEDEPLIALQIEQVLADAGAEIVGPATSVGSALSLARSTSFSCALLDFRLGQETADRIADVLTEDRVPFAFLTGQPPQQLQERWPGCEVISKPALPSNLVAVVMRLMTSAPLSGGGSDRL